MATVPTLHPAPNPRASARRRSAWSARRAAAAAPAPLVDALVPGRLRIACGLLLLGHLGIAARLYWLQVYRHDAFMQIAQRERRRDIHFPARRGGILDRNLAYLVNTQTAFTVVLDPNEWWAAVGALRGDGEERARQEERVREYRTLAIAGLRRCLPQVDFDRLLQQHPLAPPRKGKRIQPIDIVRVDRDRADAIRKLNLLGVGLLNASRRVAANGSLGAHVVGFLNAEGVGVEGLESKLDQQLRGTDGVRTAEFVSDRPIPGTFQVDRPRQDGREVVLTLDSQIQHQTEVALGKACTRYRAESGTAIVLDPSSGDVLALANWPAYNVNQPGKARAEERVNRAVSFAFEPGSTLKVVTVAAALETGVARLDGVYDCSGKLAIGRRTIHCAHPHERGHGRQRLIDVIRNSCNVATAQCGLALGDRRLHSFARKFGFGEKTGICLPAESPGQLADPSRRAWPAIKTANVGFGQGISVTPLQLAAAYGVFVDGVYRAPRLVRGWMDPNTGVFEERAPDRGRAVITASTAAQMRRMLEAVVEQGTGTQAQIDGYAIGGKTGTAQIAEHGGYHGRFVASFVGLAPVQNPQFVILVAIRDPKGEHYGGVVAAPVFREIAQQALYQRRIPADCPRLAPPRPRPRGGKREDRARFAEA